MSTSMSIGTVPGLGAIGSTAEKLDESTLPTTTEDGDHERFSHYVRKEKVVESAVTGKAVRALCGKKWVPGRDPEKFPICPTCKEIYATLKKE
jgi:hypothetical protein